MAHARQQYQADGSYVDKQEKEFSLTQEVIEKLDSIEPSAERNAIQGIKVNGVEQPKDQYRMVDLTIPGVEDNLESYSNKDALSARQGRVLYNYIKNLQSLGKFLSNWNAATWLPMTNPSGYPYNYHTWDYFVVSNVATGSGTNYRPEGDVYQWQPSTTVETENVEVSDMYFYDWVEWLLMHNSARAIAVDTSLSTTSENPVENRVVTNALNGKQENLIAWSNIQIAADGKTISATDTTYDNLPAASGWTDDTLVTTGDKYSWNNKQDTLTAWANIQINGNTISATDTVYWAWSNIQINNNIISATDTTYTASDFDIKDLADSTGKRNSWDAKQDAISDLATIRSWAAKWATSIQPWDDVSELNNDAWYITNAYHDSTKQDKLIAWSNIQIATDGKTISATDTTYTAGTWIAINNWVISNTQTSAEWWNITWDIADQTDLQTALSWKQDTLTAWSNVTISGNTISATDTTYSSWTWISINSSNVISNSWVTSVNNATWDVTVSEFAPWTWTTGQILTKTASGYGWSDAPTPSSEVSDVAYASSWDGVTTIAPSKNAVYDKISAMDTTIAWKQATISDLATIRSNASAGKWAADTIATYGDVVTHNASEFLTTDKISNTAYWTSWNGVTNVAPSKDAVYDKIESVISSIPTVPTNVSAFTNDAWYITSASLPTVNNKTITIQKNWTSVGDFTLNQSTDESINITVPVTAADVSALPASTKYAASLSLSMDSSTYVVTAQLKDQSWNNLWAAQTIDLPIESVVVSWTYDSTTKKVILTLKDWSTIDFSIADLVSWLQNQLTAWNLISLTWDVVKNKALFVIKESDVTVTTDDTKWVAPYNTSYWYTNITINNPDVEWVEGALYTFIVDTTMAVASANRNVRVRLWSNGTWIPVMNTSAILPWQSYFIKATIRYFQYTTKYESWWAIHMVTDSNTTYSSMTAAEITAWTWTTARTITPANLKTAIQTWNEVQSVNWATWTVVLDADDISDTSTTNKFVTATDITNWNAKADASDIKIKLFTLSSTSDTTGMQSAVDWYFEGKVPLLLINGVDYYYLENIISMGSADSVALTFHNVKATELKLLMVMVINRQILQMEAGTSYLLTEDTWVRITGDQSISWTKTFRASPFILTEPSSDAHAATKKYVDDNVNTKTFFLSSTSDTATALEAVQWYLNWWNPILSLDASWYGAETYILKGTSIISEMAWNRYMLDFYSTPTRGNVVEKIQIYTTAWWEGITSLEYTTPSLYSAWTWISISWKTISNSWVTSVNGQTWAVTVSSPTNYVTTDTNQTVGWTKTFSTSPVVPSKTTAASNSGTAVATEAQVYAKQDTLVSGTNIKTINSNSLLGSGNIAVQASLSNISSSEIKTWTATTQRSVTAAGLAWAVPRLSTQSNNLLANGAKIRAGSETDYQSLWTYDSTTIYLTV